MSLRSVCSLLVCLIPLGGCVPLLCQTGNYHIELSDGDSGRVVLVNDSNKTIEAFHISGRCSNERMEGSYDALNGPGDRIGTPSLSGGMSIQSDVVAPGGRMITMTTLLPRPSVCEWKARFDAVIYSDGGYEGDQAVARGLQARRDGLAMSARYWADRFRREKGDGSGLKGVATDSKFLSDEDSVEQQRFCPGFQNARSYLACEYWQGRKQADSFIEANLQKKDIDWSVERWQKKIDGDASMKKLEAIFPLPDALKVQEPASGASLSKQ